MDILSTIGGYALDFPDKTAVRCGKQELTYRKLWNDSERLAAWLLEEEGENFAPVAVYGHKSPWMLVCFLACVKSGRAYCPIDCSVPNQRVEMILECLDSGIVLTTEEMPAKASGKRVLSLDDVKNICEKDPDSGEISLVPKTRWVQGEDTWYIIFTSGSTGVPKGVQISADCLNHYLDWSVELGTSALRKQGQTFLNQAPFSFDLSVMDLYTSLASGGTLYCLEKSVQGNYRSLMDHLKESRANVWVSTPSFADMCLSEKSFQEELLPDLELFLFCGEALGNRTVKKLHERFPNGKIMNTYGPTESTVAVTEVLVTEKMAEEISPLPVGVAKPGTVLEIWDEQGNVLKDGEKGEIIILGNTVSTGYFKQKELTEKAFFETEHKVLGKTRGYHTGDKGYLIDGMLYYCGRIDLQIKLHGYRIELEDIESNIRRLEGVTHAVVLPNVRDDKVKSLSAFVVEKEFPEDEKAETARLKEECLKYLPDYMIPKKFVFLEQMPMTNNGKADRNRLKGYRK
ncbi:MAG: D-alanine--poly(phosphoribitol) ligase subunit DltA [Eubacteriales bacterium]|nr:D-alanine--poly(phosphoribitol) ligase subunit DltA [Eubacteriales bacterium]